MAIHAGDLPARAPARTAAPFAHDDPARVVAWRDGAAVTLAAFARDVAALAATLPAGGHALNLCEDRYHFLVGFAAALARRSTSLLPPSRAPAVLAEVGASHPGHAVFHDGCVAARLADARDDAHADARMRWPALDDAFVAAIGFTSGSTGAPRAHDKTWHGFVASNAANAALIRARLADAHGDAAANIVATVPPQHMYGMETSVLLPIAGGMAVHAGRPLFPAEVADALAQLPAPRVLVSTPLHLRALVESGVDFPPVALVLSATAPLDAALAQAVEARLGCELREMFGSTETCVIAHRRTAREDAWTLQPGVALAPEPDGTRVTAPWLAQPTPLQDLVELLPGDRFVLRGRNVDLIEIAGKRASLADLTRRVLAVPGVRDAVVFQPDHDGSVRRVAAIVVAPGLTRDEIARGLRGAIDPAFLPRPLIVVDTLPRNDVGKLARAALLQLVAGARG